ncbi:hypothetical protein [Alishewanella sp. HL-SH06]|uniref:hypothetical protein n=1 Tax=Alishewanella sp. HL-SH06 TaxID=3461144 RepID=UPI004040FCB5
MKRLYPDIEKLEFSLKTSDINIARKLRDKFNGELAHNSLLATDKNAKRFRDLVREMSQAQQTNPDWDLGIYPENLGRRPAITSFIC